MLQSWMSRGQSAKTLTINHAAIYWLIAKQQSYASYFVIAEIL